MWSLNQYTICSLVIAARTESKLKETQKLCQQYSQDVFAVKADVGKEEDTKWLMILQSDYYNIIPL